MKKITFILLATMILSGTANNSFAQDKPQSPKKVLKLNAPREVKRQKKTYEKDGYYVAIGAPSLERQLTSAWMREVEKDDNGYPLYIVATGRSVGETQIAAKLQATEAAKLELAGTIATNVAALIENNIANTQLNTQEAASVTKTVAGAKNIIAQEIGRTMTIVELYKDLNKNIEANVRIAYNSEMAMDMAKKVVRQRLEEETDIVQQKLEKLLAF